MTKNEEQLFEIARQWAREAPPGEASHRFKHVWGWRLQKHLDEGKEALERLFNRIKE